MAEQHRSQSVDFGKHRSFTTTSAEYVHDVYRCVVGDSEIEEFLETTTAFDTKSKKWALPSDSGTAEGLVSSFCRIFRLVVQRFVHPVQPGVERAVMNMHNAPGNAVKDEGGYAPCPNLVIQAYGPSFEDPLVRDDPVNDRANVAFCNVASYSAVKLGSEVGTAKECVKEMESYAREVFAQQPNRIYVRSLVLTEGNARLIHFDRAGAEMTPLFDIHEHPATFVRLVVGLSSANERLLGIDDSIQWTIVNGRKCQGTLTTTDPNGDLKMYPIVEQIPILRDTFLGKGATCWRVRDPGTSEELVVKDSWRPDDRPAEHELLELIKGIPGVVQMVAYESGRGETKDHRSPSTTGRYQNRVGMRTMLKSYGKPIECFTTATQLLSAIRDAIAGHQRLTAAGLNILHRDVSHNNILLGADGALEGERGILIDLDMAFRATEARPKVIADYSVGTRIFQSLSVLSSSAPQGPIPPHDHLDDLESFFFVLLYMFLMHKPDGSRVSTKELGPSIVLSWDGPDVSSANTNKYGIIRGSTDALEVLSIVEDTWGAACLALYEKFHTLIRDLATDKLDLLYPDDGDDLTNGHGQDPHADVLEPLLSHRDDHYAQVLSLFDEAIDAYKASTSPTIEAPISSPPSCPSSAIPLQPTTLGASTHLRRSSRIRKLVCNTQHRSPPQVQQTQPTKTNHPASSTTNEPRRSTRIFKRRLEEAAQNEGPPPKSRRTKQGPRVTTRPR